MLSAHLYPVKLRNVVSKTIGKSKTCFTGGKGEGETKQKPTFSPTRQYDGMLVSQVNGIWGCKLDLIGHAIML